jgi:protein-disulfide isomerase
LITGHQNAMPAAKAAYCAGQQAPRLFWELHDWLFANQNAWSGVQNAADSFRKQAIALGVDGVKYDACAAAPATEARILQDQQDGNRLGIEGTPSIFVNDWYKFGAGLQEIQQMVVKAEQGIHPPPTATPLPAGVKFFDPDPARPGLTYDGSPTLGDVKAPLLMLIFEDLKSADVAQYVKTVEPTLRDKYVKSGQVRFMLKLYPTDAPKAAGAAFCAASQGKFWEFRDLLFSKQAEWKDGDDAAMLAYARTVGLDETRFKTCLADAATQAQVDEVIQFGQDVGVPAVPAFLFVDLKQNKVVANIVGAQPLTDFESKIQAALNPITPTPAPTTVK